METTITQQLNSVQKKAVEETEGPALIIAGAGSGKTRVLTYKIAHLLQKGVPPYAILALTFTNKAAKEMKTRIASLVDSQLAYQLWMGTFHSVFAKILRIEAEHIGFSSKFTIYDTDDAKSLIRTIVKDLKLPKDVYTANLVLRRISSAKNNLITARTYTLNKQLIERDQASKKPEIYRIYEEYEKRCRRADAMDFDDLLLQTNILFRDHLDVLEKYQQKFKYLLVDEYQDTNHSQYIIVKKLSALNRNITVVGDDAQSIYTFRGAKIENILNFEKDYPEHQVFKLEQNYRSTKNIVGAANSIIKKNENQLKKEVFSENEDDELIKIKKATTDIEEGYIVANDIFKKRQEEHLRYEDFAILYRTNMQSRIMEEALRKRNIPYKIYGGFSFYQRKEIKDLLAYLRLISNPKDNEALKRIINFPLRGIGKTSIEKLEIVANFNEISLWEVIEQINLVKEINAGAKKKIQAFFNLMQQFMSLAKEKDAYEVALSVAQEIGILKSLQEQNTPESISQHENILELLNGIKDYANLLIEEEGIEKLTLDKYLENIALITSQDNEKDEDKDKVTLMTIHSAKGLEFKNIHIVGVEQDLFPSMMSKNNPKELEEERRLFYVAITRAEKELTISYALSRMKYGKFVSSGASFFLNEIDTQYTDNAVSTSFFQKKTTTKPQLSHNNRFNRSYNQRTKLKPLNQFSDNFKASPSNQIRAGAQVIHERFGKGKVLQISNSNGNKVATIFFENIGQKNLLLKFAKLKVIS